MYKTGTKKFDEFCKKHKIINPMPVDQRLLCYYITYLAQQGLADSTIRVYLSALRHHHIAYDIPEPDRTKMPKLKLVDSGIRRTKARTPKQIRLPVTPDILRQVYKHWYSSRHDYETIMLWSVSTLCFFGFSGWVNSSVLQTQNTMLPPTCHSRMWQWIATQAHR